MTPDEFHRIETVRDPADVERDLWEPWATAGLHVAADHTGHASHPDREQSKTKGLLT